MVDDIVARDNEWNKKIVGHNFHVTTFHSSLLPTKTMKITYHLMLVAHLFIIE